MLLEPHDIAKLLGIPPERGGYLEYPDQGFGAAALMDAREILTTSV
jgi:hypothetical protein